MQQVENDQGHSPWYIRRFQRSVAEPSYDAGEARLVDAMVARGSLILNVGFSANHSAHYLSSVGHHVIGVDTNPTAVYLARRDYPGPQYIVSNYGHMDLAKHGITEPVELILCSTNVITEQEPSSRVDVLQRFVAHLADEGRVIVGFESGRGYTFRDFLDDAATAGLSPNILVSGWNLKPFTEDSNVLVAVLGKSNG